MKISLVCESLAFPSGFGEQSRMLAEGLAEIGHEVTAISRGRRTPENRHPGVEEIPVADIYNISLIDKELYSIRPDACILFWHSDAVAMFCQLRTVTANCPTFAWLPWEASSVNKDFHANLSDVPNGHIVHLSEYSKKLWGDKFNKGPVIPHCFDDNMWKPLQFDKKELRRKWGKKLRYPLFEDTLIILNLDRNIHHKRWDLTMDYLRRLKREISNVALIGHCRQKPDVGSLPARHSGYDLMDLAKAYEVNEEFALTDFDWTRPFTREELLELFHLCDIRISTSSGEGFGVPSLEAGAIKVPQILNNITTIREIVGESYEGLVQPASRYIDRGLLWDNADTREMVKKTVDFVEKGFNGSLQSAYEIAHTKFSKTEVIKQWDTLLTESIDSFSNKSHWGWRGNYLNRISMKSLVMVLFKSFKSSTILELFCRDGFFMDTCLEMGLKAVGIEPSVLDFGKLSPRSKEHVVQSDIYNEWPKTDIITCADIFELIPSSDVISIAKRISQYEWGFIRMNHSYPWGGDGKLINVDSVRVALEACGMRRRLDLEEIIKKKMELPNFSHDIWYKGETPSMIPGGILKVAQDGNK